MTITRLAAAGVGLAIGLAQSSGAHAVEIGVLSSTGVKSVVEALVPAFERTTGNTVVATFDAANIIKGQIDGGASFDLAILTSGVMEQTIKQGKVVAGSQATIARAGIGVAVRAGAPKPDIGSPAALKRTLLDVRSIAYTSQGASGTYFAGLIERLGIADAIKAKAHTRPGGAIAELVVSGEADMAVQLIPELKAVAGVEIVGPLPAELQDYVVLVGAVGSAAKQPQAAAALLKFLTGPEAIPVKTAKGMDPG